GRRGHGMPDRHGPVAPAPGESNADGEAGRAPRRAGDRREADTMIDPGTADPTLTTALRAIAAEDAALGASPAVGANVMAAFDRVTTARRRRRARMLETAVGLAAVLVAAVAIVRFRQTSDFRLQTSHFKPPREVTTAFMPLAYGSVPIAHGHVVR